jgi:hypothetical protein
VYRTTEEPYQLSNRPFSEQPSILAKPDYETRHVTGPEFFGTENSIEPGLFTMRGRRHGESLIHWDVAPGLWFRQVTHAVKLTNLQNLPGVRRIASKDKPDACRRE